MATKPQIVAPTIVRFSFHGTYASHSNWANVWDVSLDEFGVGRDAAVASLVQPFVTAYQDHMFANISNAVFFTGYSYIDLDSTDGTTGSGGPFNGHPKTGDDGNNACSPAVAYLLHKSAGGHRGQKSGRSYRVGCRESSVGGDGFVDAGLQAQLNTAANAFMADVDAISLPLGFTTALRVVHVKHHNANGDPDEWESSDVNVLTHDAYVATQRRRQR